MTASILSPSLVSKKTLRLPYCPPANITQLITRRLNGPILRESFLQRCSRRDEATAILIDPAVIYVETGEVSFGDLRNSAGSCRSPWALTARSFFLQGWMRFFSWKEIAFERLYPGNLRLSGGHAYLAFDPRPSYKAHARLAHYGGWAVRDVGSSAISAPSCPCTVTAYQRPWGAASCLGL